MKESSTSVEETGIVATGIEHVLESVLGFLAFCSGMKGTKLPTTT